MNAAVEAALRRHRAVSIGALALLTLLAWTWLLAGAGMGMDPLVSFAPAAPTPMAMPDMPGMDMSGADMSSMAMPGMDMAMPWTVGRFALSVAMWWVMMVAMMLPSAAPTILLYARAASLGSAPTHPPTGSFLAGYLLAWGGFSLGAAGLQTGLETLALLAPMEMASRSHWLSGGILIAAGLYQVSPLKDVCLRQCRNPAQFLSRHYRPGVKGALRMGLIHGSYCVGCCWLLMTLLFVGGVMNLAWIALLTLIVALEKLLPYGRIIGIAAGLACMAWGGVLLLR
jgi:predicted metal-binding membrane protein